MDWPHLLFEVEDSFGDFWKMIVQLVQFTRLGKRAAQTLAAFADLLDNRIPPKAMRVYVFKTPLF
jgi:hypothetical protein